MNFKKSVFFYFFLLLFSVAPSDVDIGFSVLVTNEMSTVSMYLISCVSWLSPFSPLRPLAETKFDKSY